MQTNASKLLRATQALLCAIGAAGLAVCVWLMPDFGRSVLIDYPEFSTWYWPWLIFSWLAALPCFAALVCGWQILSAICRGQSFTRQNARRMRRIALLAVGEAIFLPVGATALWLCGYGHPAAVCFAGLLTLVGLTVAGLAAILTRLIDQAAALREDSELTI